MTVVTNNAQRVTGQESLVAEKATVIGPCRVIPAEFGQISCRSIDIDLGDGTASSVAHSAGLVLSEVVRTGNDKAIAFRNGYRWTPEYSPVSLGSPDSDCPPLRDRGVYLITGGLGGMGLQLAGHLARTVGARLVLCGRSGLPPVREWDDWIAAHSDADLTTRRINAVRSLEEAGAEVMIGVADVADRAQMRELIDAAVRRFGPINGVIHTAGIAGAGVIQLKTREAAAQVLAAKISGTLNLAELLSDPAPDFMLLCSSMTAILGAAGQIDYTAANAFLDAFAARQQAQGAVHTVAVNWPAWREVGMAIDTVVPESMAARRGRTLEMGLDPDEGTEVFRRALNSQWPQLAVSPYAFGSRLAQVAQADAAGQVSVSLARTNGEVTKNQDLERWFYAPMWHQCAIPRHRSDQPPTSRWLLFCDPLGVGRALAGDLAGRGADVVCVYPGASFQRDDDGSYQVSCAEPGDFSTLASALKVRAWQPEVVVYLWGLSCDDVVHNDRAAAATVLDRSFYGLLNAIQALSAADGDLQARIEVVTNAAQDVSGGEPVVALKATVTGLCRVIPQEFPGAVCRHVDVAVDINAPLQPVVDQLRRELTSAEAVAQVAYRGTRRWVRRYEPIVLSAPQSTDVPLRERGVYLITGGLGSLGLTLANHLVRSCQARVVLASRSALPARDLWDDTISDPRAAARVRALRRIEQAGGEVLPVAVDVTDEAAMRALIDDVELRWGPLNGVIHAAGVLSGDGLRPLLDLQRSGCEELFAAKVRGVEVLDQVLRGRTLDFCVLMSSLAAILGGLGHAAYAAANAYLDAFANMQRAQPDGLPWLSVDWDSWNVSGAADNSASSVARFAMTAGEGIEAFRRVLATGDFAQLIVSTGSLEARLEQWVSAGADDNNNDPDVVEEIGASAAADGYERPELDEEFIEPRDDL
jgi:NAD(P)-dependent dehydrogenase (short-subunit alcohol dehydrogenase family)